MVKITERKTKRDWAYFLEEIALQRENADKITLVMDNLNTHVPGSLYETFSPAKAKALWDRFEFVYTPKHGSWLNMAEIELNVLTGQCLNTATLIILAEFDRVNSIPDATPRFRSGMEFIIGIRNLS